jgi:hypothetical protein
VALTGGEICGGMRRSYVLLLYHSPLVLPPCRLGFILRVRRPAARVCPVPLSPHLPATNLPFLARRHLRLRKRNFPAQAASTPVRQKKTRNQSQGPREKIRRRNSWKKRNRRRVTCSLHRGARTSVATCYTNFELTNSGWPFSSDAIASVR